MAGVVGKTGKRFIPTDEQRYTVEVMTAIGLNQDIISQAIGCSDRTLRDHFKEIIAVGKAKVITKVADSLIRQALAGNMTAAIFFLKTQAGWRETATVIEQVGPGGGPIRLEIGTDEQRKATLAMALSMVAPVPESSEGG